MNCKRCDKRPATQNPDGLCAQCRHLLKRNPHAPVKAHLHGKRTMTEEERFWSYLPPRDSLGEDECWEWQGNRDKDGYGKFRYAREEGGPKMSLAAHRFSWKLLHGEFPTTETLDHLCRNRACVNPRHLEPVGHQENILRGFGLAAENAVKTHCKHGHEFTPENTYTQYNKDGSVRGRGCKTCRREEMRRAYYKRKKRERGA